MLSTYALILVLSVSYSDCLTTEHSGALLCVDEIIGRHFTGGELLVISMPAASNHTTGHGQPEGSESEFMDKLLENTHKRITWPVITSFSEAATSDIIYKHQSYIILLWAEERDDFINTLESQVENMKSYGASFNHRGKFLVVVTDFGVQSPETLAMDIIEILWNNHQIANSVIMIPNLCESVIRFDLYTWFPYESGQCGTIEEVVLLERCILENDRALLTNISLVSSKIPLNVHGCPIRVSTWDRHPNMILATHNKTDGSVTYEYSGIEAVYLLLLSERMNMTIKYLPPPEKEMYLADFFTYSLTSVFSGQADIAMGNFPLHYLPFAYSEPTIPYVYGTFKWYVQCARPIRRIDNLINVFTAPAWSVLVLLLILSAVTFWCIANSPHSPMTKESIVYRYLSECFTNAWAVFLGVSVPEMPRNFRLRIYFFLFVCYCFAISTVFQAHFTSFLIEPKFEKQIQTFDEIQNSELRFLQHPSMLELGTYMNYHKYKKLRCHEQCPVYDKCLSRLLDGEKATMLMLDLWAEYATASSRRGQASLCPIDQTEFSMGLTMYLSKGSLFRHRFNVLIQRCLEAGLGEKYRSQLTWNVSLSRFHGGGDAANGNNVYFAFTVYHLRVAFCLLAFGGALSCIAFIAELLTKLHFTRLRRV